MFISYSRNQWEVILPAPVRPLLPHFPFANSADVCARPPAVCLSFPSSHINDVRGPCDLGRTDARRDVDISIVLSFSLSRLMGAFASL